jgi:hypothetical protein
MKHEDTNHRDDQLDVVLQRAILELDPPPPTPREQIWARILAERGLQGSTSASERESERESERDVASTTSGSEHDAGVIRLRPRRQVWLVRAAALAAMLVIGIGLGRVSLRQAGITQPSPVATAPATDDDAADVVPTAYRLVATQHLERTEALFASLAVDARTRGAGEVSGWARELLTDTRLLLASPAALDPALSRLLEDLELVLSQIAAIPAARAEEEVELIQDGINQSDVLLRMRAATAGPALVGT